MPTLAPGRNCDAGLPAQILDEAVVGVDDEVVTERFRDRLYEPVLQRAVVAEEERTKSTPGGVLRLGQSEDRFAGPRNAADCRLVVAPQKLEQALLLRREAAQTLFLILDLAPDDRHERVPGVQRLVDGLHLARRKLGMPRTLEPAEHSLDALP